MDIRRTQAELNQYHLGLWYGAYRLIIAFCLLLIYLLTTQTLNHDYQHPRLYAASLVLYFIFSCAQLLYFRYVRHRIPLQLTLIFSVDVLVLSSLTFALDGPSLHLSLLFVIAIFAATLLLEKSKALFITLVAMICVTYQHFVGTLLDFSSLDRIGQSALLSFLFFIIYRFGQIAVRRFQILEHLNFSQSLELNRLKNINRYILEQTDMGYLVLDENCHIMVSNPAACHLLGINPLYAFDKYPLYKVQPDLFQLLQFDQLSNGEKFQFESQLSHFLIQIQVQKLVVPQQTLTLLVLQDARQINQRVQQLKLAALGQLSASIAHEIRNPLAAIVQANRLLAGSDTDQQQMLSQMIDKQSQRIDKIIDDTLSMVKNKETTPVQIDLARFIPQLIQDDLADLASQIQVSQPEPLQILFDESQLRQVLINLIRNAQRHNAPDHPIELQLYRQQDTVYMDVKDYGSGVASHDIRYLFQPFFSTEISGTGLGLYLSHSFCEANRAKLRYVEQKQGACFRIECSPVDVNN